MRVYSHFTTHRRLKRLLSAINRDFRNRFHSGGEFFFSHFTLYSFIVYTQRENETKTDLTKTSEIEINQCNTDYEK